ncbi:MAG: CpaF family protein [Alphaproteobacteria bacterium]|nr:CpaF family protein [Alphaproteobacteria bacterium]
MDWIVRRSDAAPAARTAAPAPVDVRVHSGASGPGIYEIPREVIAQGGRAVLDFLLEDDQLEELMHNGSNEPLLVFHQVHGTCRVNYTLDLHTCQDFIDEIVSAADARLDEDHPLFDGSLPDGSRVNIAVPPVTRSGPSITVRKFKKRAITIPEMIRGNTLSAEAAAYLWLVMDGFGAKAANVLVVGGTGSGKTTLLNALSWYIPNRDRIVIIEDTQELVVPQPNVVRMITTESADMDKLLVNSLRMRPDRILVGEVRGPEARTLFGAMNTGHDGCVGTLHANSARESLHRAMNAPMSVPLSQLVGLDLVVVTELRRTPGGAQRQVIEITEVSGLGEDSARLNQLFVRDHLVGELQSTGIPSRLRSEICRSAGIRSDEFQRMVTARARMLERIASQRGDLDTAFLRLLENPPQA